MLILALVGGCIVFMQNASGNGTRIATRCHTRLRPERVIVMHSMKRHASPDQTPGMHSAVRRPPARGINSSGTAKAVIRLGASEQQRRFVDLGEASLGIKPCEEMNLKCRLAAIALDDMHPMPVRVAIAILQFVKNLDPSRSDDLAKFSDMTNECRAIIRVSVRSLAIVRAEVAIQNFFNRALLLIQQCVQRISYGNSFHVDGVFFDRASAYAASLRRGTV